MRVLLLGATGLIGSSIAARLAATPTEIVGVARHLDAAARAVPVDRWILLDLRRATSMADWLPHLDGVDAVVNCAGALQDNVRDSTSAVHDAAPSALWQACAAAGVRRIVHLSALGADRGISAFSATKQAGDEALMASGLDWVILRPSVVVGPRAYGGNALFRGLAVLPWLPVVRDAGRIDVVQIEDVVETVARLLEPSAPSRLVLELAGPDRLRFEDVVQGYRRWLGLRPAAEVRVPGWAMAAAYRLGDLVSWFGWRAPIRTTARREIARGATGDAAEWIAATGIQPRSFAAALAARPAGVQERWFANLYLLKPVMIGTFALFWLMTGFVSLGPGYEHAERLMRAAGAGDLSAPSVVAGGLADIAVGLAMLFRRTARAALVAALLLSVFYIIAGTLLLPGLWRDPLGPMMKIWPILALNLACLAILGER